MVYLKRVVFNGDENAAWNHIDTLVEWIRNDYGADLFLKEEYICNDGRLPELNGQRFYALDKDGVTHFFDIYVRPIFSRSLFDDLNQDNQLFLANAYRRMGDIEKNAPELVQYDHEIHSWVKTGNNKFTFGAKIYATEGRYVSTFAADLSDDGLAKINAYFHEHFKK